MRCSREAWSALHYGTLTLVVTLIAQSCGRAVSGGTATEEDLKGEGRGGATLPSKHPAKVAPPPSRLKFLPLTFSSRLKHQHAEIEHWRNYSYSNRDSRFWIPLHSAVVVIRVCC